MFKKKKCKKCQGKLNENFDFCPYCGIRINGNQQEWGLLGKNDFVDTPQPLLGGGLLNKMLGNAMKMLENEMQKGINPNAKFQMYINGKKVNFTPKKKQDQKIQKIKQPELKKFTEKQQEKFSKLKKQEPETKIIRLGDRIVFEINMPGASLKDLSIKHLQNSIEIKALADKKAYYKIIQLGNPIINYYFEEDKFIIELAVKN